jgi:hypothetical protein
MPYQRNLFMLLPVDNITPEETRNRKYIETDHSGGPSYGSYYYLLSKTRDGYCYVVKWTKYNNGKQPLEKWRIKSNGDNIRLYWHHPRCPNFLVNGKHYRIAHLKYRAIFKCVVRLLRLKKIAKTRVYTRHSFRVSGTLRRHTFAPAHHRILAFI